MRMYGRVGGIGMSVGPVGILLYVIFVLPVVAAIWLICALVTLIGWLIERYAASRA